MESERRTYPITFEPRAADGSKAPVIKGHAAVFNRRSEDLGGFVEVVLPGSFADTIKEDDIRALWNHESGNVLGRNTAGTLRLWEDAKGLSTEIDPPASATREVEAIARGDVSQMSFGFRALDDLWETKAGVNVRTIKRVRLFDVSPVTFPAYAQTDVALRSLLAGAGLDFDALARVLVRAERKLVMEPEDLALLRRSIGALQALTPADPAPELGRSVLEAERRVRLAAAEP